MKIGVFDSGVGGRSVANAIRKAVPEHEVLYAQDKKNVPYGMKSPETLFELVLPILQDLVSKDCEVIVIACNTVTTTIIPDLRKALPVPLVGIEPMVKPAVKLTKTGVVAVCATPTTLASKRYNELKKRYAQDVTVIEPDCSRWADMIEKDAIDQALIRDVVEESIQRGADVIVMGCTHYHWIEKIVERIALDRAIVLQPEEAVIKQLKRVLARLA
jgi:glutamate racemase